MNALCCDPEALRREFEICAGRTDDELRRFWDMAAVICRAAASAAATGPDPEQTRLILHLLVCHLAELFQRGAAAVGRLNAALQGSVSVQLALASQNNARWFDQTQYGAAAWQMLLPWRSGGLYVPGC